MKLIHIDILEYHHVPEPTIKGMKRFKMLVKSLLLKPYEIKYQLSILTEKNALCWCLIPTNTVSISFIIPMKPYPLRLYTD